jgi:uncharacterized protein YkwD
MIADDFLPLAGARKYMLELINRDRATEKLPPVELDDAACEAGQEHAKEMAANCYLSHWDMKGRKPLQRYTEAGGSDWVMENCENMLYRDVITWKLATDQRFSKRQLDEIEKGFFGEKPPNDGHRRNTLRT